MATAMRMDICQEILIEQTYAEVWSIWMLVVMVLMQGTIVLY